MEVKHDGCSVGVSWIWLKLFDKQPPWFEACIQHDVEYIQGGTFLDRLCSDWRLVKAVWSSSLIGKILALPHLIILFLFGWIVWRKNGKLYKLYKKIFG